MFFQTSYNKPALYLCEGCCFVHMYTYTVIHLIFSSYSTKNTLTHVLIFPLTLFATTQYCFNTSTMNNKISPDVRPICCSVFSFSSSIKRWRKYLLFEKDFKIIKKKNLITM